MSYKPNIDLELLLTTEEINFVKSIFDTDAAKKDKDNPYGIAGASNNDKLGYGVSILDDSYEDYINKNITPTAEQKVWLDNPLTKSIYDKTVHLVPMLARDRVGYLKQLTINRIKNLEETYFTKDDALKLKQEITDNSKQATTDFLLYAKGEMKLFTNHSDFIAFLVNAEKTFGISLHPGVDLQPIAEDNLYLATRYDYVKTVPSGTHTINNSTNNMIQNMHLPMDYYEVITNASGAYGAVDDSSISRGIRPMYVHNAVSTTPSHFVGWPFEQSSPDMRVYSQISLLYRGGAPGDEEPSYWSKGNATSWLRSRYRFKLMTQLNRGTAQAAFLPKTLPVIGIYFKKDIYIKVNLVSTTQKQIDDLKAMIDPLKQQLQTATDSNKTISRNFVAAINALGNAYIVFREGQQMTFRSMDAFNKLLDTLGINDPNSPGTTRKATRDDFDIVNNTNGSITATAKTTVIDYEQNMQFARAIGVS